MLEQEHAVLDGRPEEHLPSDDISGAFEIDAGGDTTKVYNSVAEMRRTAGKEILAIVEKRDMAAMMKKMADLVGIAALLKSKAAKREHTESGIRRAQQDVSHFVQAVILAKQHSEALKTMVVRASIALLENDKAALSQVLVAAA
jgi:hypothetical protein